MAEGGCGTFLVWQADPCSASDGVFGLGEALRQFGGVRVEDGFCAWFSRPADAVAAVRALRKAAAGQARCIRMAISTGEAGADPAAERCLNLAAIAHGGQALMTAGAAALIGSDEVKPLGRQRLRDLRSVEDVVQLGPDEFPPLRTLDHLPHNLPVQTTSFVGRRRELAGLKRLLAAERMITLTGPGGTGKTRMALQTGADVLERFPGGVWLAELAGVNDAELIEQAVAAALRLREEPHRPLLEMVITHLTGKRLLLLLDNCEHLVAGAARLVGRLLAACPDLCIITTSREPLGIAGEIMWPLPTLSLPESLQGDPPARGEAVRLFVERAQAASPTFSLTPANLPTVADVCRRLDGIPLAIELAAARTRMFSVEQIGQRLDQRFRLLTTGDRQAPVRHQTLRGAIDWSYELLSEQEQVLWRRLSVFTGGFGLEAAEAVCSEDAVELLSQLVDKSLVVAEEEKGEKRFRLLETVREYGWERLRAAGEEAALRAAHRDWYFGLAERAEPLLTGPEQGAWLDRLEQEHDNLRQALRWSLESGDAEHALRLGAALWRFWYVRGYFSENRERIAQLVGLAGAQGSPAVRARVLNGAGAVLLYLGEVGLAREYMLRCLAIWRELGDLPRRIRRRSTAPRPAGA